MGDLCSNCRYAMRIGHTRKGAKYCCNYLEIVGHRRGCPAGDECSKYEEGQPPDTRRKLIEPLLRFPFSQRRTVEEIYQHYKCRVNYAMRKIGEEYSHES